MESLRRRNYFVWRERKQASGFLRHVCVGVGDDLTGQDHELVGGGKFEGDTTRPGE